MSELEPHKPGRRLDKHFRWRGTEVSRVEAIADAVFGLVLAMLLLNEHTPDSFSGMFVAVKALIPFGVTFAFIAMVWFEHYLFFRRYDLHDGPSIALTFVLLFLVLGFAYPLKLLFTTLTIVFLGPIGELGLTKSPGEQSDLGPAFLVYSCGYLLIFSTIALLYRIALGRRAALDLDACELFLTRSAIASSLVHVAVASLSLLLTRYSLWRGPECPVLEYGIPGWIYCLLGPLMGVHGSWEGRRLRQLGAA